MPTTTKEQQRLGRLQSYGVLNTNAEPALDDLVRIAQAAIDAPIVMITFVDESLVWVKSKLGSDITEVPRDVSFCAHTLDNHGEILEVQDANLDERFIANPLVTGPTKMRFYAGAPLITPDGLALGTLCIFDQKPRSLDEPKRLVLSALARQVIAQLELRRTALSEHAIREELRQTIAGLRESDDRYRSLVSALDVGVVMQEHGGAILTANASAERILGLTVDQMKGLSSMDPRWRSVREDGTPFPGEEHPAMQSLSTGRPCRDVVMGVRKPDSTLTWILIHSQPLFHADESQPYAVVTSFHDITDARNYESGLKQDRDSADQASRAKSEFLATMSHEIRTPLNSIMGVAALLQESELEDDQKRLVQLLRRSGDHLLELITDVLDMTRIEAGHVELVQEILDPGELLQRVGEIYEMRAREKHIDYEIRASDRVPTRVVGDPGRIRQVLVNLIGNAIKFTESGGVRVTLDVSFDSEALTFVVSDSGIGIPADKIESMFDPFVQVDGSPTRKEAGTGLGLAISRRLATLMNGSIRAESQPGEGSRFYFSVPIIKVPEDAVTKTETESTQPGQPGGNTRSRQNRGLNILVVDDNPDNLMLIDAFLKNSPHTWQCVNNGENAIQKFANETFDVVLMDVQMPGMDGYATTRQLRSLEEARLKESQIDPAESGTRRAHILALTANAFQEDIDRSLQAGCDAHLTKPITKQILLKNLNSISVATG
ncbi:MAG: ATP-binding protein [bacterium]|nr:ATP-binding protein [bacterium]